MERVEDLYPPIPDLDVLLEIQAMEREAAIAVVAALSGAGDIARKDISDLVHTTCGFCSPKRIEISARVDGREYVFDGLWLSHLFRALGKITHR